MKKLLFLLGIMALPFLASAQQPNVLQFSGVVVTGDSLQPVAFTNIIIKNTRRGTICDYYGFFSLVAESGDTVEFSSVGYKPATFVIPDTLQSSRYSLIQLLNKDTVYLAESVVYPWPTKEQFKEAFLTLNIPDDDYERARKNLEATDFVTLAENVPVTGATNFKLAMQRQQNQLYYAGQAPPNNLLNPIAWARFIESWKNGDFKRQ